MCRFSRPDDVCVSFFLSFFLRRTNPPVPPWRSQGPGPPPQHPMTSSDMRPLPTSSDLYPLPTSSAQKPLPTSSDQKKLPTSSAHDKPTSSDLKLLPTRPYQHRIPPSASIYGLPPRSCMFVIRYGNFHTPCRDMRGNGPAERSASSYRRPPLLHTTALVRHQQTP